MPSQSSLARLNIPFDILGANVVDQGGGVVEGEEEGGEDDDHHEEDEKPHQGRSEAAQR